MIGLMALLLVANDPGMAPLDFLIGHCWRGELPPPGQQDTHCFTRFDDGRIKDIHTVTKDGQKLFSGETVYRWDRAAKVIRYVYVDDAEGRMTGTVKSRRGGGLDFSDGLYIAVNGTKIVFAVTWKREADGYTMRQTSTKFPALNRTTRYKLVS